MSVPCQDRRVSIVVPTKDRPTYLRRCLAVALAQEHVDFELIVVDDGSAVPVVDDPRLSDLLCDPRVRVVRHETARGVAAARNRGIGEAASAWLAFLDDDDFWASEKLGAQLYAIEQSDCACWSYTGAVILREDLTVLRLEGVPPAADVAEMLTRLNPVPGGGSSVVASTAAIRELNGFDERFSILADWDLWLRLSQLSNPAVVSAPLVGYVLHNTSMSIDTRRSMDEFARLAEKHSARVAFDRCMFQTYMAELEFRLGRRTEGLRYLVCAAVESPRAAWQSARDLFVHTGTSGLTGDKQLAEQVRQWRSAGVADAAVTGV